MKRLCAILLTILAASDAARILAVMPMPSYSHQIFYHPIWRELSTRGHEVVLLTTDPINDPSLTNLTEINWNGGYKEWRAGMKSIIQSGSASSLSSFFTMVTVIERLYALFEWELQHPDVQKLIKSDTEHFDLVMIEYMAQPMFTLKDKFNCPFIMLATRDTNSYQHAAMGNPTHLLQYPDQVFGVENPTFFERLHSVWFDIYLQALGKLFMKGLANKFAEKHFGSGYMPTEEIFKTADMLFINVNPVFNYNRPLTPSTISLAGGMHIKKIKPLPENLAKYLDDAKDGVIYFSLGTNVRSKEISDNIRKVLLDAFSQIPYKILWKFESDELPGKPDNVKIMKWIPQQDVLRHPNIKVFVTQGGIQSLEESLFCHVPVVGLAFFGDQMLNSKKIIEKGIGLAVNPRTMTVDEFKNAVLEVVQNPKYKQKVIELADLIKDEPMTGLEKAVWWTEYVIRNKGAQHLKGPTGLPLYQYYYLDIFAFIFTVIAIAIYLVYFVIIRIVRAIRYITCKTKVKTS